MSRAVMSLREATATAVRLGFHIRYRGGEIVFSHPKAGRILRVNSRRKDAPRILMLVIDRVSK
jgi:hypothetical protein